MDRLRLSFSVVAQNALWDKYNKNCMGSVGQWERKKGWNLSKRGSHQITSFNSNNMTLFKIGQWDTGLWVIKSTNQVSPSSGCQYAIMYHIFI